MNITLHYQRYVRQNFSTEDFFNDIIRKIDESYGHKVSEKRTMFYPISLSEVDECKSKGYLISRYAPNSDMPHLVIDEISITFTDITGDYKEVLSHLIEEFGEHSTKYSVLEEGYLNDTL